MLIALNYLKVDGVPKLHPKFRLVIYTSFKNEKDAMGMELLEALAEHEIP